MNAKIMLDDKHVASAIMIEKDIKVSVNHFPKLITSPRFVKFALSVKSVTDASPKATSTTQQSAADQSAYNIIFDTSFIKGIFSR